MDRKFSLQFTIILLSCVVAILVLLIHEPHPDNDTWSNWFFGQVFVDTGKFLTPGRSPLYAVYTSLFFPLGYPYGPMVARMLDVAFIFSGLFVLFRPYAGRVMGLICALIWTPGLMNLGTPVDGISVASLFWAIALRKSPQSRLRLSLSYAFLILAGMFRPNLMLLVPVVALYDALRLIRRSGLAGIVPALRPRWGDFPLALLIGASVLFTVNQSDHRWNNGWLVDAKWFGTGSKSLAVASHIGTLVQRVVIEKHDSDYENHDIYFVVKEEFGEVNSLMDLLVRYDLYLRVLYGNKQILHTLTMHTDIGRMLYHGAVAAGSHKFAYPVFFALLLWGLVGFYKSESNKEERLHYLEIVGATIFLTVPILFAAPTARYTLFYIPLFAAAGLWFGRQLFERAAFLETIAPRTGRAIRSVLYIIPFVLFSNGISRTDYILTGTWDPAAWQRPHLVKEVYEGQSQRIFEIISECRGVMVVEEHMFLATFSPKPEQKFYVIYEIPPFGRLGDGGYKGLNPGQIDCLIIAEGSVGPGMACQRQCKNTPFAGAMIHH